MDDSAIMRDEVIQSYDKETKTVPTNFNEKKKKKSVKRRIVIFYLHFY